MARNHRRLLLVVATFGLVFGTGFQLTFSDRGSARLVRQADRAITVTSPATVGIIGDSLSASLVDGLARESRRRGLSVVDGTVSGCGLVRGQPADADLVPLAWTSTCDEHVTAAHEALVAERPDVVLWLSSWETANRVVDGRVIRFGTPRGDARLLTLIHETARPITARGTPLVFLTVPNRTTRPGLVAEFLGEPYSVRPEPAVEARQIDHLNDLLRRYVAAHPRTTALVDLDALVCPGGDRCPFRVRGVALRPVDGRHFAGDGPEWVAQRVLDRISPAPEG
jgi:hypothetical protein